VDRVHRERALHRDQRADAAVHGLELAARDAVHRRRRAGAAVALEVHAEEPEGAERLRELTGGERAVQVPAGDVRADLLVEHGADRGRGVALVLGEDGVEGEELVELAGGGRRRHAPILATPGPERAVSRITFGRIGCRWSRRVGSTPGFRGPAVASASGSWCTWDVVRPVACLDRLSWALSTVSDSCIQPVEMGLRTCIRGIIEVCSIG
jgi:hypothetical protein